MFGEMALMTVAERIVRALADGPLNTAEIAAATGVDVNSARVLRTGWSIEALARCTECVDALGVRRGTRRAVFSLARAEVEAVPV